MNLHFEYNKEKDIWCLLNKGKGSINSSKPTEAYTQLIASVGENPDEKSTAIFIERYLHESGYVISDYKEKMKNDFNAISANYKEVAERVFGVSLQKDITVYITVNNRCPYSIEENWFFVSTSTKSPTLIFMHELWHFYTWYRFGEKYENKIGKDAYNTIKESLTVLLNVECKQLLPKHTEDTGYPQHADLRAKILIWWNENPDIEYVFEKAMQSIS